MKKLLLGGALSGLALAACGGDGSSASGSSGASASNDGPALSLAAQVGQQLFFDKNLSGGKNMSCATCHDPAHAYGPPNGLAAQPGSDPSKSGLRATPSLRYKAMTPSYGDNLANPSGVALNMPGGGLMWDGRAAALDAQPALPLLNPIEMNNASPATVVQSVQAASYAPLFQQAFGTDVFADTGRAFAGIGKALMAFQVEDPSFAPYSSKYDLFEKQVVTLTAAEQRGLAIFFGRASCTACHAAGGNFGGSRDLMTDFTYRVLGVPRNDGSIPNNPSPIAANQDAGYYDMGLCGPERTDHQPATAGAANAFCGMFKVPTLRNTATRTAFFHNGAMHTLEQVLQFYNTRDTNPEYWYPATGGTGTVKDNPGYALQPRYVPGAAVQVFNDLPAAYRGNVSEDLPMGTGSGPRLPGAPFPLSEQDVSDIICFLNTLTDGYQPPATPPTGGTCVN